MVQWRAMARPPNESELGKFQKRLLEWFKANRRELPWRRTRNAYRVWVSETMLQQTRTAAVLPRYRSFLRAFPSLKALARTRTESVLRAWSGLGYYRRARNLRRAAAAIVRRHGGRFPREIEQAQALPGVGAYTARAVLSIAYDAPLAVLDGNVARVIARRESIEGDLRGPGRWKRLQALADDWLARKAPGDWNQAMMELGATVCTPRNPHCGACPVRSGCRAYRLGIADRLPRRRTERRPVRVRIAAAVLLDRRGRTLLVRSPESGSPESGSTDSGAIFSRMWQFPAIEAGGSAREELERRLEEEFALAPERWEALPRLRHTVTYREISLEGWLAQVPALPRVSGQARTVVLERVEELAVSSATKKLARAALARLEGR